MTQLFCPTEMTRRHRCRSGNVSLHNQPWKFWKTISTAFFTKAQVVFHTSIIEKNKNVGPKEWFHGFLVSVAIPSTFYFATLNWEKHTIKYMGPPQLHQETLGTL